MRYFFGLARKLFSSHKKEGVLLAIFIFSLGIIGDFLSKWYMTTQNNSINVISVTNDLKEHKIQSGAQFKSLHDTENHYIDHNDTMWATQNSKQNIFDQNVRNEEGVLSGEYKTIRDDQDKLLQHALDDENGNASD